MRGGPFHDPAGIERAGPSDEARHSDPAFVNVPFEVEHPRVVTRLLRAVIGQEHHDRVASQPRGVEPVEHPADVGVDVRDHRINASRDVRRHLFRKRMADPGLASIRLEAEVRLQVLFGDLQKAREGR